MPNSAAHKAKNAARARAWARRKYAEDPAYHERVLVAQRARGKVYRDTMPREKIEAMYVKKRAWAKERLKRELPWKRARLKHIENKCSREGIPFNMTLEDVAIPAVCPVFGTPLALGGGWHSPTGPSVDRIRPELGYVKGNVRIICYRANTLKNNATLDEHRRIYLDACRIHGVDP